MEIAKWLAFTAMTTLLAACGADDTATQTGANAATGASTSSAESPVQNPALATVLAGDHRTDAERERDQYRNPIETLKFFGVEPDMKVVEIWPGGGWYTNVLAPYIKSGGGTYYAAGFSPVGASERVQAALATFKTNFKDRPEIYGDVQMTVLGEGEEIAAPGTADVVLTFRNIHNFQGRGSSDVYFKAFYEALKPGGVLGVVEHRADGIDGLPNDGSKGYAYEADVIAMAEGAGFTFVGGSEVNANAADTKDHPYGVWTLKPVRRSSAVRGQEDPGFDRAKFDAIGESDRMTLKFVKPVDAEEALLE